MLAPLEISIYLNNALKAKHVMAEVDSDTPLPEVNHHLPLGRGVVGGVL
jgi:hypothetical protein